MRLELVGLALLMFAATYPSRAVPLLAPGIERLPAKVLEYLRLVGPACLAALAASNTVLLVDQARQTRLQLGIEAVAVVLCIAVVAWRRSLLLGLVTAVVLLAATRALTSG